jgi:hypothetical protein
MCLSLSTTGYMPIYEVKLQKRLSVAIYFRNSVWNYDLELIALSSSRFNCCYARLVQPILLTTGHTVDALIDPNIEKTCRGSFTGFSFKQSPNMELSSLL